MGIGLTEEHRALAASVQGSADRDPTTPAPAELGVLGLHVPEEYGGQGYGLAELAVALEVLGERRVPGPHLATALGAAVVARGAAVKARAELLPGFADGSLTAAVAVGSAPLTAGRTGAGACLTGRSGPILGAGQADVIVLPAVLDGAGTWVAVDAGELTIEPATTTDESRACGTVTAEAVEVPEHRILGPVPADALAAVLLGAEACGVAAWAVRTAAEYAKVRVQFGRPIGQFQGVKHRCANMLVELERARAAVWDAARALDRAEDAPGDATALAAAAAGLLAPDAAVRCAADAIQVLGGIGYTFEHDAHRYYRRALSLRAHTGNAGMWAERAARLAASGAHRPLEPDLPEEAVPLRERIRAEAAALAAEEPPARLARFAAEGWIMPYLPAPWGRGAGPLEQVIIQQEFRAHDLRRPNLGIAAWAVPSIVAYGTAEQRERFLPRTFTGEITWCQLFSEPGAGSDLASLSTRAVPAEGGWRITGRKIWTSLAQYAHFGICLARTDPEAPKHRGLTYFLVEMSSPGVEVRPLKEINGDEIFNEVLLDDVFVPDDRVVGAVDDGWRVARDTLSHERVALGDSWGPGSQHTDMIRLIGDLGGPVAIRPAALEEAGRLYAEGQAISALGLRATLSRIGGNDPGTAPSVRKLLGMRHAQRVSEFCWSLAPASPYWNRMILTTRAFTIGGGTTEVQLNIIAERALGLPRDP